MTYSLFIRLSAKQSDDHIAACNEIPVDGWRNECLNLAGREVSAKKN